MRPPDTLIRADFRDENSFWSAGETGASPGRKKFFQGLDGRKGRRIIRRPDKPIGGWDGARSEKVFVKGLTAGIIAV